MEFIANTLMNSYYTNPEGAAGIISVISVNWRIREKRGLESLEKLIIANQ